MFVRSRMFLFFEHTETLNFLNLQIKNQKNWETFGFLTVLVNQ